MDIDVTSKVDTGTLTSNTKLFDTDTNSLVFKLGFDNIRGIGSQSGTTFTAQGISYQRKETIDVTFSNFASATGATITSPTNTTFETEGLSTGSLVSPQANYILVASNNSVAVATSSGTLDPQIVAGEIVD